MPEVVHQPGDLQFEIIGIGPAQDRRGLQAVVSRSWWAAGSTVMSNSVLARSTSAMSSTVRVGWAWDVLR